MSEASLSAIEAFVETVRAGGMAAAARKLGSTRARVSRQVQQLETALGAQLLVRTTRALRLTEAGSAYLEVAEAALTQLAEGARRVAEGQGRVSGVLRVNAPMSFGVRVLGPLLPRFLAVHPMLELQLTLSDEFIDPIRSGHDVTLRIGQLADSGLIARRLMDAPRLLAAAPSYLAEHGTPAHPAELERHRCLNYSYSSTGGVWALRRGAEELKVAAEGPLCANNGDVLLAAAEAGLGLVLLPEFIVCDALAAGRLVEVLPDWRPPPIAVHALYPPNRQLPLRTRRFLDFLIEALGGAAARTRPSSSLGG
jgi:DNA-binding transcriptional LysR family regulator